MSAISHWGERRNRWKELWRYKKATYGPRADRLSESELAQALLEFAEELEQKPLPVESLPQGEAEPEVRRVQRRKERRALRNSKIFRSARTSMSSLQNNDVARAAASCDKKSAARRVGRSKTGDDFILLSMEPLLRHLCVSSLRKLS